VLPAGWDETEVPSKGFEEDARRAMSNVIHQHRTPLTAEELEAYAGKWVAIRDGAVVAAADSLQELRAHPEVRREDAVYVVPESSTLFY
jgi:hypothetical protein